MGVAYNGTQDRLIPSGFETKLGLQRLT